MPDVAIDKGITLDLLPDNKPGTSTTSDMPKVETHPDAVQKPLADEAKTKEVSATPEQPESPSAEPEVAKKPQGVQKRLDELTRNWREEQRARERSEKLLADAMETMKRLAEGKPAVETKAADGEDEPAEPDVAKYTDQAAYNTAYRTYLRDQARWVARQEFKSQAKRDAEERQKRSQEDQGRRLAEAYQTSVSKAREKYADYDDIVHQNPDVTFTQPMADAIAEAGEMGAEIAYHLGQNPTESQRIAKLSPRSQFLELGKIAAKLADKPAVTAPVSKAPKPIKPITSGTGTATSSDEESMEAYAAKRTKQLLEERRPGARR